MSIATYTFLPWLRRGISNQIASAAGTGATRATVSVELAVASDVSRTDLPPVTVHLVGPGDVTGIHPRQIIRTEPRNGVSDFEPNYLAAVDFYDEDFPWRYSPVAPDNVTHRLAPWIVLVVAKDPEYTRKHVPDRPLPSFVLTPVARRADMFPVRGQEWAWAHVHFNAKLAGSSLAPDLAQLGSAITENPDVAYSRILCPRKLDANTNYTAFLVPAFETGRKAGLGESVPDTEDGTVCSWEGAAEEFPIYFEWQFRTGINGDFESLVRALVPRDMDPRVGIRDMSIAHPGFGVDIVTNPPDDLVALEGALLAPTTVRRGLAPGSDFIAQIAPALNAATDAHENGTGDPIVSPPIYGRWHAHVDRVDPAVSDLHWVEGLNLDPRYRAAAGLGARVARQNQETYMRIAWEQIGDVLAVNRQIRRAQLATKAAAALYAKSLSAISPARTVGLAARVFSKVLASPTTLASLLKASRLPDAAVSPALRKHLRPRGRVVKRVLRSGGRRGRPEVIDRVLTGINAGRLSAAPSSRPAGGATLEKINEAVGRTERPAPPGSRRPADSDLDKVAYLLSGSALGPRAIAATSPLASFMFASADTDATLVPSTAPARRTPLVHGDTAAAADMRRALITFGEALATRVEPQAPRPSLDLTLVHQKVLAALEPHRAFAARFAPLFRVGQTDALTYVNDRYVNRHTGPSSDTLQEVMNYPDIKDPTYAPLAEISSEYFLPNLKLIPNNTVSLLKANQPFIESYLAGLNHEFARELLWREFPTDQRGSYFRQFWDVSSYVDTEGREPKQLAEDLKDVPPLHEWRIDSVLGAHNHRDVQGDQKQVVLVIRGDLLKRYPNTFIYAQRAKWGTGLRANRLVLSDETGELFATAPQDPQLRFPLYKARVSPDTHFLGFDLTFEDVRGDSRLDETADARAIVGNDLGWFFVIQEAVGEPRFGLDVDVPTEPSAQTWDNLSWANLDLTGGQVIDLAKPFVTLPEGAETGGVSWDADAAQMAYVFYQDPVLVAIHGRHMLKTLTSPS
jgi:hypothetical protein